MKSVTLTISTASSVNVGSAYQTIPFGGPGLADANAARICVTQTASGTPTGDGTLRFVLWNETTSKTLKVIDAVISQPATAVRDSADGASGGYVAVVGFGAEGDQGDVLDLAGASATEKIVWKVGVPAAFPTNVTAFVVTAAPVQGT